MKRTDGPHRWSGVFLGVALMLVGAFLLADKLALADTADAWRWWPFLPIALGASKLVQSWGTSERGSGAWLIFAGLWFLCVNFRVFGFSYHNSWPVLIVALGVSMVLKAFADRGPAESDTEAPHGN